MASLEPQERGRSGPGSQPLQEAAQAMEVPAGPPGKPKTPPNSLPSSCDEHRPPLRLVQAVENSLDALPTPARQLLLSPLGPLRPSQRWSSNTVQRVLGGGASWRSPGGRSTISPQCSRAPVGLPGRGPDGGARGGDNARAPPAHVGSQSPEARAARQLPQLPGRPYNSQPCPEAPAWTSRGGSLSPGSGKSPGKSMAASCRPGQQASSRRPGAPELPWPRREGSAPAADEPADPAGTAAPDPSLPAPQGKQPGSQRAANSGSGAPQGEQPLDASTARRSLSLAEAHADVPASCSGPALPEGQQVGTPEGRARLEHGSTPLPLLKLALLTGEAACTGSQDSAPLDSPKAQHAEASGTGAEHSRGRSESGSQPPAKEAPPLPHPVSRPAHDSISSPGNALPVHLATAQHTEGPAEGVGTEPAQQKGRASHAAEAMHPEPGPLSASLGRKGNSHREPAASNLSAPSQDANSCQISPQPAAAGLAGRVGLQEEGAGWKSQALPAQTAPGGEGVGGQESSSERTRDDDHQQERQEQLQVAALGKAASEHQLVPSTMPLLGTALCPPTQVQLPMLPPPIHGELIAQGSLSNPAAGAVQHGWHTLPQLHSPMAAAQQWVCTEIQVSPAHAAAASPTPPPHPVQEQQPDLADALTPPPSPLPPAETAAAAAPAPQQQPGMPRGAPSSPDGLQTQEAGPGRHLHGTGPSSIGLSEAGAPTPLVLTRVAELIPGSEGTQRALAASQIRNHYHSRFVVGDAAGGVFEAVHAEDVKAVLAAAELSRASLPLEARPAGRLGRRRICNGTAPSFENCFPKGTWQLERRLVEAGEEHGLYNWDLESLDPAGGSSPPEAPAGLSQEVQGLLCSESEAAARAAALQAEGVLRPSKSCQQTPAEETPGSDADAEVEPAAEGTELTDAMPPVELDSPSTACPEVQTVVEELLDAACALEMAGSKGPHDGTSRQPAACGSPGNTSACVPASSGTCSAPSLDLQGLASKEQQPEQPGDRSRADGAEIDQPIRMQGSPPALGAMQAAAEAAEAGMARAGCAPAAADAPEGAGNPRALPDLTPAEDAAWAQPSAGTIGGSFLVADTQLDDAGRPLLLLHLDTQLEQSPSCERQQQGLGLLQRLEEPCSGAAAQPQPAAAGTPPPAALAQLRLGDGSARGEGSQRREAAGEDQKEDRRHHLPLSASQDAWACVLTDAPASAGAAPALLSGAWRSRAPRGAAASGQLPQEEGAGPPAAAPQRASPQGARAPLSSTGLRLQLNLQLHARSPGDSSLDSFPQRADGAQAAAAPVLGAEASATPEQPGHSSPASNAAAGGAAHPTVQQRRVSGASEAPRGRKPTAGGSPIPSASFVPDTVPSADAVARSAKLGSVSSRAAVTRADEAGPGAVWPAQGAGPHKRRRLSDGAAQLGAAPASGESEPCKGAGGDADMQHGGAAAAKWKGRTRKGSVQGKLGKKTQLAREQKQQMRIERRVGMLQASTMRRHMQAKSLAGRQGLLVKKKPQPRHTPYNARAAVGGRQQREEPAASQATEVRELQMVAYGAAARAAAAAWPNEAHPSDTSGNPASGAHKTHLPAPGPSGAADVGFGEGERGRVRSPQSKRLGRMSDAGMGGVGAAHKQQPAGAVAPCSKQPGPAAPADPYSFPNSLDSRPLEHPARVTAQLRGGVPCLPPQKPREQRAVKETGARGGGSRAGQRACKSVPPRQAAAPQGREAQEQGPVRAAEPQGRTKRAMHAVGVLHALEEACARERVGPVPAQGRPKRAIRQPKRFRSPSSNRSGSEDTGALQVAAADEPEAVSGAAEVPLKRLRRGREVLAAPDQALQEDAAAMQCQLEESLPACPDEQAAHPPAGEVQQHGACAKAGKISQGGADAKAGEVRQGDAGSKAGCHNSAADKVMPSPRKGRALEQPAEVAKKRRRREIQEDNAGDGGDGPDQAPSSSPRQPLPQPMQSLPRKLGCSKCRFSSNGCRKCRPEAGLLPLAASAVDRQAKVKKRASLPGLAAAAAAPAGLGGSPSPGGNAARRRRRSEPAAQALRRGASNSGITKAFSGRTFLVTGIDDSQDRRDITALLTDNGGRVLDSIPLPQDEHGSVDAVVAGQRRDRRPKFLLARVTGCAVLKPAFVERCVGAGRYLQPQPEEVWLAAGSAARVFQGRTVYLHGDATSFVQHFGVLLLHAGLALAACATVAGELQSRLEVHSPGRRRVSVTTQVTYAACDVAIANAARPLQEQPGLRTLLKQARRLGVPVLPLETAIQALMAGQPLALQRPMSGSTSAEAPEPGGGVAAAAAAAAQDDFVGGGEALVEDSESLGRLEQQRERRLSTGSVSLGRPAAAPCAEAATQPALVDPGAEISLLADVAGGGHPQPQPPATGVAQAPQQRDVPGGLGGALQQLAVGERGGRPCQGGQRAEGKAAQQPALGRGGLPQQLPLGASKAPPQQPAIAHGRQLEPQQPTAGGARPATAAGELQWVDPQEGPPPGLGLEQALHRQFYGGIHKGGEVVRVGDDVELAPPPGEEAPQVSRITALWAERRPDGPERLLARTRRFYRPADTQFAPASSGRADELYLSGHVDDGVPLLTMLRRCHVAMRPPAAAKSGSGSSDYFCMYGYDHICSSLRLLGAG